MHHERANHYRTLQVEPGSHPEIITASYRRLMNDMQEHPERQRDQDAVSRIEQAYAVLGNRNRRIAYDVQRAALRYTASASTSPASNSDATVTGRCHFCGELAPPVIGAATRCATCEAPLAPVMVVGPLAMPYCGRAHVRVPQTDFAHMHLERSGPAYRAKLRDLSVGGLSLFSGKAPLDESTLRVIGPSLDAVVRVVKVRPHGPVSIVHARMLTRCRMNRTATPRSADG